jgi:hypothetical protein
MLRIGAAMAYDDPPTPAHPTHPAQGQRCPACGHLEPDLWARFCGVCGATLGAGAQAGGYGNAPPSGATVQLSAAHVEPPARYVPSTPPTPAYPTNPAGGWDRPQPVVYTVPYIGYAGPARIGAAVSAAFTLLPCVLFGFLGAAGVHGMRSLLNSWQNASVKVPVPLVNVDLNMNFIELLRLRSLLDFFVYWDDRLWLTFAILWFAPWIVWIVAGALFGLLLAAIYNLIGKMGGGVRVTMMPAIGPPTAPAASWQSAPPTNAPIGWSPPPGRRQ